MAQRGVSGRSKTRLTTMVLWAAVVVAEHAAGGVGRPGEGGTA